MSDIEFADFILSGMPHTPTAMQSDAVNEIVRFLFSGDPQSMFLLTGYAGTGKTTLVAALVQALRHTDLETILLAPTGRAAKVMALYSDGEAFTIHKEIYRQNTYNGPDTAFDSGFNKHETALFIVDEASMIARDTIDSTFGTGRLLDDLVQYVYSRHGCRLMFVGDTAQLPPVGCEESPALSVRELEMFDMNVYHAHLTQVVRQDAGGILHNATMLRTMLATNGLAEWPKIRFNGFADIVSLSGNELIEALEQSYARFGQDETIVVTRSNKRAGIYNQGIRTRILDYEEMLSSGDRVLVVKNNYHWVKPAVPDEEADSESCDCSVKNNGLSFIANGEQAVVRRFRNVRKLYGFTFADITLQFPDYDYQEVTAIAIMDTLTSEAPALTHEQQQQLFNGVWEDYPEIRQKRERMRAVREDNIYNALQIKYGYAVTCHKAQGGQWSHVYIDIGYMTDDSLSCDYLRWLYTAITRATQCVYMVNWPKEQSSD